MDLLERWERLADREKWLVGLAGLLVPVALLVILVIRPLSAGAERTRSEIAARRTTLRQIEDVAARLGPQAGGAGPAIGANGQALVVIVDQTTRKHGLGPFLRRNEPDGASGIRLRFENAPFDPLVEWFIEVQQANGLNATAVSIDPGPEAGRVNCTVQLTRTSGT